MFYDLHCTKCGKDSFEVNATVADKVEKRIYCPECGSNMMETIFSPINVHVKSNNAAVACPNSSTCGSCCHRQPA